MTKEEELKERLQKLWAIATNTCGAAPSQIIQEIRQIEQELAELERIHPD